MCNIFLKTFTIAAKSISFLKIRVISNTKVKQSISAKPSLWWSEFSLTANRLPKKIKKDFFFRWIFATYFESGPSARSLVPCFDEPQYKAVWTVTLSHPADTVALGNMPDQGTTLEADGNCVLVLESQSGAV